MKHEIGSDGVIAIFAVDGRASPWRAPTIAGNGGRFKGKPELEWTSNVAQSARTAMKGRSPYDGPVELHLIFYITQVGRRTLPDLTNIIKSTEDALQGIVIVNDRQVCRTIAQRIVGDVNETRIQVEVWEPKRD